MTVGATRQGTVPVAGFILAGNHAEDEPATGLHEALRLFAYGEGLGYQAAGIRQRKLERGVSSALPFLAAAGQRTRRIRLETAVVPLGHETPFRLAEDVATVDALSGGRIEAGLSTSAPHADLLAELGRSDAGVDAFGLLDRFLEAIEGRPLAAEALFTPYGPQVPRVQPHVPGLRDRVWLGGGSVRSIRGAAERGLKLALGNLASAGNHRSFEPAQRELIEVYDAAFRGTGASAVSVERVIVPIDGATAAQRERYEAWAAPRRARTAEPTGGLVFQQDLYGTAAEIIDRLASDPSFDGRTELRVALPYAFAEDDYRQILADIRHLVLPPLGWTPEATLAAHHASLVEVHRTPDAGAPLVGATIEETR